MTGLFRVRGDRKPAVRSLVRRYDLGQESLATTRHNLIKELPQMKVIRILLVSGLLILASVKAPRNSFISGHNNNISETRLAFLTPTLALHCPAMRFL